MEIEVRWIGRKYAEVTISNGFTSQIGSGPLDNKEREDLARQFISAAEDLLDRTIEVIQEQNDR